MKIEEPRLKGGKIIIILEINHDDDEDEEELRKL